MLAAGILLIVSGNARAMLLGYLILAGAASAFTAAGAATSPLSLALFLLAVAIKLVAAPAGIAFFLRSNAEANDLLPTVPMPLRVAIVVAFAVAADAIGRSALFAPAPYAGLIAYALLCSAGAMVVHRNLIAQVLGLLAIGAAITLSGAVLAPQFPEAIEVGESFDALVAMLIGLALVRAFIKLDPTLDVEHLRNLHG